MTQPPGYPAQPGDPYGAPGQPPQAPPPQAPPPSAPDRAPAPDQAPQPGQAWPTYGQPEPPTAPMPGNPYAAPGQPYPGPVSGQPYPGPVSGQPYPGPVSGQPYAPGQAYPPVSGQPYAPPGQPPYAPGGYPGAPGYVAPPPKRKRGLMITMIVLGLALVLCGGGGAAAYFVLKGSTGPGQATPVDAVNGFLKAVYKDKDVTAATKLICSAARDKISMTKRIDEIRRYDAALKGPVYTWPTPTVEKQDKSSATVLVPVKVTTDDDKTAESKLTFLTTNDNGWWVCEINTA
jgi:flagellar basal body-associated protein FliL